MYLWQISDFDDVEHALLLKSSLFLKACLVNVIQQPLAVLKLLVRLQHFIFALYLAVSQFFYDVDVLVCEFIQTERSIAILV